MLARLFLFVALVMSVGCTSMFMDVNTSYDPNTNFGMVKTYAWINQANELYLVDPRRTRAAEETLIVEIDRQLQSLGLEKTSQTEADLVVFFKAGASQRTEATAWTEGEGPYGKVAIPQSQRTYTMGSLIVSLADPARRAVVWQGTADVAFEKAQEAQKSIPKALTKMFKDYPPN